MPAQVKKVFSSAAKDSIQQLKVILALSSIELKTKFLNESFIQAGQGKNLQNITQTKEKTCQFKSGNYDPEEVILGITYISLPAINFYIWMCLLA